jgi:hypothetical protein
MEKTGRLINLLVIFMPLLILALMAAFIGLVLFEFRRWKILFY